MRRTAQVAERAAAMVAAPTRSYWTTARAGSGGGRRSGAAVAPPREMSAGPFAAGGQRRFLADEKKEEKQQQRAGAGVFSTFMKSIRDQMATKAESDEDLAAAQERLEQARLESIKNAEAAIKRAQEAAEQVSAPMHGLCTGCPCPREMCVCSPVSNIVSSRRRRSAQRSWRNRRGRLVKLWVKGWVQA